MAATYIFSYPSRFLCLAVFFIWFIFFVSASFNAGEEFKQDREILSHETFSWWANIDGWYGNSSFDICYDQDLTVTTETERLNKLTLIDLEEKNRKKCSICDCNWLISIQLNDTLKNNVQTDDTWLISPRFNNPDHQLSSHPFIIILSEYYICIYPSSLYISFTFLEWMWLTVHGILPHWIWLVCMLFIFIWNKYLQCKPEV